MIRYASDKDLEWLNNVDDLCSYEWKKRCIENKEYIVAITDERHVGFLRFSYFWSKIPYMDLIRVNERQRNKGIGKQLFLFWQNEMKNIGFQQLMTSSTKGEDEPLQWHIKNGFENVGELSFGKSTNDKEIFLIKPL